MDKFMVKIPNFYHFGAVLPHFCPDKRDIWDGGADRSQITFIGAMCRPCGRGGGSEKPILNH